MARFSNSADSSFLASGASSTLRRARSLPNQDFGKRSTAIGEVESALIGSAPMPQDEVCRIEMAETRHRYGRS
jgi:hypothetical protein